MSKIIGRKKEIEELEELYNSDKAEFVAIYGRRRVGKTFLVKEVFQNRLSVYHSGLSPYDKERKITMRDQLEAFYASLMRYGMEESHCPKSWMEAFRMLGTLLDNMNEGKRQLIFIDELPWMDTPRSKFLMAFENFWNSWGAWHDQLMLIVCGSATSWMLDNLVHRVTTDFEATVYNVHRRVSEANSKRIDPETEKELTLFYGETDELTSGYIRIEREGEPRACINIPVIDWRGNFMPCSI